MNIGGEVGIVVVVIVIAVVGISLGLGARGRGKPIECPECNSVFKRPAFSQKSSGMGIGLGGPLGYYACPKCGHRARTSNFRSMPENTSVEN
jgi:predicted RNA-binding Zn-ribbon protein involved in translation (DUF1610 family)